MPRILITGLFALATGCASVATVRDAPESKGEEQIFNVSYGRMVDLVAETLPSLGLENIERESNSPAKTVFLGTASVDLWSWGEIVRVTISEIDPAKTSVRIYWRHAFRDGAISFAPNWTEDIFSGIKERLP